MQSHKNKESLYGRKSLESGRIGQYVYKYRASPTVRFIDFITQCTIPKRFIPQVDKLISVRINSNKGGSSAISIIFGGSLDLCRYCKC
jgi:hypothetical protein